MIQILHKEDCCGCSACAQICPHGALTMQIDGMGFKYPSVDNLKCTDCGLCERICAFHEGYDISTNLQSPLVYAARHKDFSEIKTSRSGAVFIALSDYIFQHGGVIYGAGYTGHFQVVHKRVTDKKGCFELKGSKYVQSDMKDIFSLVKQDLAKGLKVLFTGTPCQTAGLNSYLGKKYKDNLYLCDIVCHGVPSPFIWRDYLSYWERKMNSPVKEVNFRDKAKGWRAHIESFVFQNGKKVYSDIFTFLFYKHIMFRPSCSVCKYTNIHRPSDITIADFWGWQKVNTQFNADDMGCSLVLVNTEKGKGLFDSIKENLNLIETEIEKGLQPNLKAPSVFSPQYAQFCKDYEKRGFDFVLKKYGNTGYWFRSKKFIKSVIKKLLRR